MRPWESAGNHPEHTAAAPSVTADNDRPDRRRILVTAREIGIQRSGEGPDRARAVAGYRPIAHGVAVSESGDGIPFLSGVGIAAELREGDGRQQREKDEGRGAHLFFWHNHEEALYKHEIQHCLIGFNPPTFHV
jgi:hypothetical protein